MKNLYLNFSQNKKDEVLHLINQHRYARDKVVHIPQLENCTQCLKCDETKNCTLSDSSKLKPIVKEILKSTNVYFYIPVSCNRPSTNFSPFINRLRPFSFPHIEAHIVIVTSFSGVSYCLDTLPGILNAHGFTLKPYAVSICNL